MDNTKTLQKNILHYLATHNTLSLATQGSNAPQAAALFYVNSRFTLYFVSDPSSRHGNNLRTSPAVAATINEDPDNWKEIKGLQIEGEATLVQGKLKEAGVLALYLKKFPFAARFLVAKTGLDSETARKVGNVRFYRIVPERIWFIDNSQGFGHRELLILEPSKEYGKGQSF